MNYAPANHIRRYYFDSNHRIYSDKLSRFICECNGAAEGAVIKRLEQRFDRIYIDEIQDMAGWDIDLIQLLLKSAIHVTLVGDHRQATYRTNNAAKNAGFSGGNIIKKFREWKKQQLCDLVYELETHRCNQSIANIADTFFPTEPRTKSLNTKFTGHDGVFIISTVDVKAYVKRYKPQVLRLDIRTDCDGLSAMNFGESKGLTFDRVLIFPHKLAQKWLSTGDYAHIKNSVEKMYVGVSRARYSVAFVHDGPICIDGIKPF